MILIASTKEYNIKNYARYIKPIYDSKLITNKDELNIQYIKKLNPSFIFFPHWSWIIPSEIYENYECVIFHMTDLPFGRGGSPLQNLIIMGEKETKISALKATKELDAGEIYLKEDLSLNGKALEIYERASRIIFEIMINKIITNTPVTKPQLGDIVKFTRRCPNQSNIKDLDSIEKIYDYIRMLDAPTYPHAYLETKNFKIEFKDAQVKADIIECKTTIFIKGLQ
ncbi:MAG: methionyl-tRNA formyltransferase [Sulfurimonas sp.]|nr:MAG: methionyl-tRNA formyltransferase [Sulfurimonas sp.]